MVIRARRPLYQLHAWLSVTIVAPCREISWVLWSRPAGVSKHTTPPGHPRIPGSAPWTGSRNVGRVSGTPHPTPCCRNTGVRDLPRGPYCPSNPRSLSYISGHPTPPPPPAVVTPASKTCLEIYTAPPIRVVSAASLDTTQGCPSQSTSPLLLSGRLSICAVPRCVSATLLFKKKT
jgi:hypothetical protein